MIERNTKNEAIDYTFCYISTSTLETNTFCCCFVFVFTCYPVGGIYLLGVCKVLLLLFSKKSRDHHWHIQVTDPRPKSKMVMVQPLPYSPYSPTPNTHTQTDIYIPTPPCIAPCPGLPFVSLPLCDNPPHTPVWNLWVCVSFPTVTGGGAPTKRALVPRTPHVWYTY